MTAPIEDDITTVRTPLLTTVLGITSTGSLIALSALVWNVSSYVHQQSAEVSALKATLGAWVEVVKDQNASYLRVLAHQQKQIDQLARLHLERD